MARVTDEHIRAFVEEHGCNLVEITRKPDSRGKAGIYIQYMCGCGDLTIEGKKWSKFKEIPMCGKCSRKANPQVTDDEIKMQVEANGCEFVKSERVYVADKPRIFVTYICTCDRDTTRIHKRSWWEVIKRGCTCNICGDKRRKLTNKNTYAQRGDEIMEKVKETNLEKYGVEYVFQSQSVKEKIAATNLERYGVLNGGNSDQSREKAKQTMNERYGVDYAMQNSALREKQTVASYKTKSYTFPSGKTVQVQGYEPLALDILLKSHDESDILTDNEIANMYEFWYEHEGKKHRYFPDIFVSSEQKIIEVKSDYTLNYDPIVLELKMESVFNSGLEMEVWSFDSKGNLTIM